MSSRARRLAMVPRARGPIAMVMCLALLVSMGLPRRAWAQDVPAQEPTQEPTHEPAQEQANQSPPSASAGERPLEGWVLTGVDADLRDRWRATMALGYLGGFDSGIVLTEVTFTASRRMQLVAGHVYLRPAAAGSSAIQVLRAGGVWLPLRGRVSMDNRLLIERRDMRHGPVSIRLRDRLRISWALDSRSRLRAFGTVEALALTGAGFAEQRYQAGVARPAGPVSFELYWLQSRPVRRSAFNTIGLTAFWRLDKSR